MKTNGAMTKLANVAFLHFFFQRVWYLDETGMKKRLHNQPSYKPLVTQDLLRCSVSTELQTSLLPSQDLH